jgi:IclR family transcriptional regulator, acetate operon repressor
MNPTPASTTVKSALRTLDIIELVVAHPQGMVAQDIAAALAIPMSSLSYLLATLVERGYLVREARLHRAGPGLDRLRLPAQALRLADRAQPLVHAIRGELNETASFMILAGWQVEALATEASDQALRYAVEPGEHKPLHSLAAGKAILAALPPDQRDTYFAEVPRERFTPATITEETALRAELAHIQAQGISTSIEENTPGICGLACAAVRKGELLGAFAVAVPSVRFDAALIERASALLRRAAAALE